MLRLLFKIPQIVVCPLLLSAVIIVQVLINGYIYIVITDPHKLFLFPGLKKAVFCFSVGDK